eukprot:6200597-Pleurochrysis_carterae.AAC.5
MITFNDERKHDMIVLRISTFYCKFPVYSSIQRSVTNPGVRTIIIATNWRRSLSDIVVPFCSSPSLDSTERWRPRTR